MIACLALEYLHLLFILHLSIYIYYLLSKSVNQINLQNKSLTNLWIIYLLRKPESTKLIAIINLTLSNLSITKLVSSKNIEFGKEFFQISILGP